MEIAGGVVENQNDRQYELQKSLKFHTDEQVVIRDKLVNPHVPKGKKDKLHYRLRVITDKVIPRLNMQLRDFYPS